MTIDITAQNSAFLFIDVQEKLVGMLQKDKCSKKAEILARTAKVLGIKTVLTEQYPKGLGSTIPSVKYSVPDSAKFFEKTSFNALLTDGVKEALGDVKNVFIFGIETHICVYQTAMALLQAGYNVFAIKDACASRDSDEFKAGINLMEKEGVKILTVEMVIFEMLKSSKHPNFKEVQTFIK
jgi:isochorismatase hydrolase